jgi:DNA-binding NarL/FixJ family response regulator
VVDDDPLMLASIRRAVRHLPARLRFASSAEEALLLIDAEVPTLLISDYQMPGLDGMSFLERVKRKYPSVNCVLHTAVVRGSWGFGVNIHILPKPCPDDVFRDIIASCELPSLPRGG